MSTVTIGRVVIYRSRTGDYDCPAIVTATTETLNPKGVEAGHIPALESDDHVHLTVFTAGKPGKRRDAKDFMVEPTEPISENVAGCYQEWNIPNDAIVDNAAHPSEDGIAPGTWRWPEYKPNV